MILGIKEKTNFFLSVNMVNTEYRSKIARVWTLTEEQELEPGEPSLSLASTEANESATQIVSEIEQHLSGIFEKRRINAKKIHEAYKCRLQELREIAADDDGYSDLKEASEKDFWSFVESMLWSKKASLFLLENGNLRAIWRGLDGMHVGIQFLGEDSVIYVIFKQRPDAKKISRLHAIDTLEGVRDQLNTLGITLQENE